MTHSERVSQNSTHVSKSFSVCNDAIYVEEKFWKFTSDVCDNLNKDCVYSLKSTWRRTSTLMTISVISERSCWLLRYHFPRIYVTLPVHFYVLHFCPDDSRWQHKQWTLQIFHVHSTNLIFQSTLKPSNNNNKTFLTVTISEWFWRKYRQLQQ